MTAVEADRVDEFEIHDPELLARYAPVLKLDPRELFVPSAVDRYVAGATMVDRTGVEFDEITADLLDERWGTGSHLRFVDPDERRGQRRRPLRGETRWSARLGRVGLIGRLLDAMFQLSVWLRPSVPRGTTAAARDKADRLGMHDVPACYGRLMQAGEWLVAHYAYFYAMNDWRSSYRGLNDHEADWEQAWVYIDPATRRPVWIATTNHDHSGADMRRHWDDPELIVDGDRPVLFVAAGSHALMYQSGEFITRLDVPGLRWVLRIERFSRRILRLRSERGLGPALGVPFVETVGADGPTLREIAVIPFAGASWVESYRGLWGLDTRDPLEGERGPGGPKFDRRGEVRASWADPLGYANLHGTPPPSAAQARINLSKVERAIAELDRAIRTSARLLPLVDQTASVEDDAHESRRLTQMLRRRTELAGLRHDLANGRIRTAGIRDHLHHPAVPLGAAGRWEVLRAGWAALTIPALLLVAALVILSDAIGALIVIAAVTAVVVPIDQLVRGNARSALRWLAWEAVVIAGALFVAGPMLRWSGSAAGCLLVVAALGLLVSNLSELSRWTKA